MAVLEPDLGHTHQAMKKFVVIHCGSSVKWVAPRAMKGR